MASKIDIWNMALGYIGTQMVASDSEKSDESIQCDLFWDTARRTVLRDFPYSFAQKRTYLARVAVPREYKSEYNYAYHLPELCVKAQVVTNEGGDVFAKEPFILVLGENDIGILLCDISPCILHYTVDTKESMRFYDDSFVEMLAYKLASMVCIPLLKSNSGKLQELNQLYQVKLSIAMQNDASSRKLQKKPDTWNLIQTRN